MSSRVRILAGSENLRAPLALNEALPSTEEARWLDETAARLGDSPSARELHSIAGERDPELLGAALLSFAGRHSEDPSLAQYIYQRISEHPDFYGAAANIARSRNEALQGRGTFGQRSEIFFSRFFREATDPTNLASMAIAGFAFQGLRLAVSSRLLASSGTGFFTRGIGVRVLANGVAFAAEAPVFSASARGINALLGRQQDWSASALGHELASGYLMLGGLRLSGALGNAAIRRLDPGAALGSTLQHRLVHQAGMFAGVTAAHWAEQRLGLRPDHGGSALLADSLAALIHFNVSGRLLNRLGADRLNHEMESRHRALENFQSSAPRTRRFEWGPRLAVAGAAPSDLSARSEPLQMSAQSPIGEGPPASSGRTAEPKSMPVPKHSRRGPDIHERFREGISDVMFDINRLVYSPPEPAESSMPMWVETSIQVARFMAENCRADMSRVPVEHAPTLQLIAERLDQLHSYLELLRTSATPVPMDNKALELMGHIYRVPNPLVNYIDSGQLHNLQGAARSAQKANEFFISEYWPTYSVNADSGETLSDPALASSRARVIQPSNRKWSEDFLPFYDYVDAENPHIDIPPTLRRRVLLLGDVPRERSELASRHEVRVGQINRKTYGTLLAEVAKFPEPDLGLVSPLDHRTFEYVEAFNAFDAPRLMSEAGKTELRNSFFAKIQPGGIGLWMSNDSRSTELVVQTAIEQQLADVIYGSYQGDSPLRLEPRSETSPGTDYSTTNYVFFRKLPPK